jgi:hypothetical protein
MQRQQLAPGAAKAVQRLQHSIASRDTAGQEHALKELLIRVDTAAGASDAAHVLHITQQPGLLDALQQIFDNYTASTGSISLASNIAAMLLEALAASGNEAAEAVAAQPGMLPALARLLADSRPRANPAPRDTIPAFHAVDVFKRLCSSAVAAQHVAAEPAAVSGLVALLAATRVAIREEDGTQQSIASQAKVVLLQLLGNGRGPVAQLVLQQPGISAALAELLQSRHSPETQKAAVAVLTACISALVADTSDYSAARQVLQQLAAQAGCLQDVLRLLTSRSKRDDTGFISMHLLYYMVFCDGATHTVARRVREHPGAVTSLVKVLDSKMEKERQMAAGVFTAMAEGAWDATHQANSTGLCIRLQCNTWHAGSTSFASACTVLFGLHFARKAWMERHPTPACKAVVVWTV